MNKQVKVDGSLKLTGVYTVTKCKIETPEQKGLEKLIVSLRDAGKDCTELIGKLHSLCQKEVFVVDNTVATVAKTMIANNLTSSSPTYSMLINYIALGTSSTAVSAADTQLNTETYRNSVASKTSYEAIGYVSGFFSATECNGTYKEAGVFSNATGTVNSGVLISHVLLNGSTGIAKSGTETLTIDWTLTIS